MKEVREILEHNTPIERMIGELARVGFKVEIGMPNIGESEGRADQTKEFGSIYSKILDISPQ